MTTPKTTRRRYLRRTGGALFAAGLATTGGCTESLPPLGSRVRYGRVDAPRSDAAPEYRRWLPAASALPVDDLDPGYVNYVTPGRLGREALGVANREPHFFQKPYLDHFGVGYESYDSVLGLHGTTRATYVLEGEIDPDVVSKTLTDGGYAAAGSRAGYDLFSRADGPRTAAVRPDAIVWAHHDRSTALVEAVIDAERGAVDRHHETDEAFARATAEIGAAPWTLIGGLGVDPTGDALVRSMSYAFDENAIYYVFRSRYPEGEAVSEQSIREALERNSRAVDGRAVDVRIEDRTATVEVRLSRDALRTGYADATVPQITWGIARGDDSLTICHEAGETTPAETITLYVRGEGGQSATETQFSDGYERIRPGDSVTINAPDTPDAKRIVGRFSPIGADRSCQFVVCELS